MVIVKNTYRQNLPALRFIGKKYGNDDRVDGLFSKHWGDWHANEWFKLLDEKCEKANFEDGNACIGLMREKKDEPFQYWIGKFYAENSDVPNGFMYKDFPPSTIGIGWLHGNESEIYCKEHLVAESCEKNGMKIINDKHGACWFFERYTEQRFCVKDENENILLDIGFYVE